ncbi:heterokaryon incompatibility protein-domain-containing protein [Xylariaceae sp. FL0594]|nr:heterokaryon incompatibility protein-domain-containing protein [Xylariaceae sp. FL0594]
MTGHEGGGYFKPFEYDTPDHRRTRLFQLDLNGDDEPLSGKLISTIDMGIVLGNWDFRAYFKSIPEGSWEVVEKLNGGEGYDALSWVWGPAENEQLLYVTALGPSLNAEREVDTESQKHRSGYLRIRPALAEFLKEYRRRRCTRFMWIDAICLDQRSKEDKSIHVPHLRAIYENAESVIYWFGTINRHTALAIDQLERVTEALGRCAVNECLELWKHRSWVELGLPSREDEFWRGVRSIMTNPWWSRLWTLQEAVATKEESRRPDAKRVRVIYIGDRTLPWNKIENFQIAASRCRIDNWIVTGNWFVNVDNRHAFDALEEIRGCLRNYAFGTRLNSALLATMRRKATAPVEMVLGQTALIDDDEAKKLNLGFDQPEERVFVEFAKYYITQEPFECLLQHVATKERNPKLPSWCPNFASSRETLSIGSLWYGDYTPEDSTMDGQFYHAGFSNDLWSRYTVPHSQTFKYLGRVAFNMMRGKSAYTDLYKSNNRRQMRAVEEGTTANLLQLTGMVVDTVARVVECNAGADSEDFLAYESLRATSEWLMSCAELAAATRSYGDDSLQRDTGTNLLVRTLTANRSVVRAPPKVDDGAAEQKEKKKKFLDVAGEVDFVARYERFAALLAAAVDAREAIDGSNLDGPTADFIDVLHNVTRRRRFFSTAAGRIGIGPSTTEPGDDVRVVFFLPTPYLMRRSSVITAGDDAGISRYRYRLVGETYVHGFMYGEAIDLFKEKKLVETQWVLE